MLKTKCKVDHNTDLELRQTATICPLKKEDGSLAVNDTEKENLINDFFANISSRLGRPIVTFHNRVIALCPL